MRGEKGQGELGKGTNVWARLLEGHAQLRAFRALRIIHGCEESIVIELVGRNRTRRILIELVAGSSRGEDNIGCLAAFGICASHLSLRHKPRMGRARLA